MSAGVLGNKSHIFSVIKGVIYSICLSLVGILLFAFLLKFVEMSDMMIMIINQVLKVISILFGVYISLKVNKSKGLVKGICVGILYTILSFFLFSILSGEFSFTTNIIFDLLFSVFIGALSSIIFLNTLKN